MSSRYRAPSGVSPRSEQPRKRALRSRLLAAAVMAWILLGAAQAAAAPHPLITTFGSAGAGSGQFEAPTATAVDQSAGDVYVADSGNFRVQKFDAAGNFILMFGKGVDLTHPGDICTAASGDVCKGGAAGSGPGEFETPAFVAVDNSTGASKGDVYIGDTGSNTVSKFDSSGHFLATNTGSGAPSGSLSELRGVTVDALGNLWAAIDYSQSEVLEFDPSGGLIQNWTPSVGSAGLVSLDSHENVYLSNGRRGRGAQVYKFTAAGQSFGSPVTSGPGFEEGVGGLATDPASDDLYVAAAEGKRVFRYGSTCNTFCNPTESFGSGQLTEGAGLSVNAATNRVYVADVAANDVAIFGVAPGPPVIESESVSVTATSAALRAEVAPYGHSTTCVLQYVPDAGFREEGYAHATSVPCTPAALGSGFSGVGVAASLSGLQEGTTYHYRVQAASTAGTTTAPDRTFLIPSLTGPRQPDTCPNAPLRSGPSANLPDCRAYELVTPAAKNGQLPLFAFTPLLDQSNLIFASLGAFSNSGENAGAFGANYDATRREGTGWAAGPLDPTATEFENEGILNSTAMDVSQDFRRVLFEETPVGAKAIDRRLYLRGSDGGVVPIGPLVPPATVANWTPTLGGVPLLLYRGASRDLSHVFFDSARTGQTTNYLWPGDTTSQGTETPSLYEYTGTGHTGVGTDTPTLVGVDNSGHLISQCGTRLGAYPGREYNAVSRDGTTVYFTALAATLGVGNEHCNNASEGSGPRVAELYARIGASRSVAVSEPVLPAGSCSSGEPCFGAEHKEAVFQGASENGEHVFFLSEQPLVNGAPVAGMKLYEARLQGGRIAEVLDLAAGPSPLVQGVAQISSDGSRIYFVAQGTLSSEANGQGQSPVVGEENLYVHEPDPTHAGVSKTAFIAALSGGDSANWTESRSAATPDGRFLLFSSTNNLTPDAAGPGSQIYRFDSQTGELIRVSIGANGSNQNGNTGISSNIVSGRINATAGTAGVSISDDGSYVFFESSGGLTPTAINDPTNTVKNVYEYHEGHVYLISDGQDRQFALGSPTVKLTGATASGSDVFFQTADRLLAQDTDSQVDVYDARIDGGFSSPAPPAPCQSEGCQGAPSAPPVFGAPASVTFSGPANAVPTAIARSARPKIPTRAQRLARALKACARKPRRRRPACIRHARRAYGTRASSRHSNHRSGK